MNIIDYSKISEHSQIAVWEIKEIIGKKHYRAYSPDFNLTLECAGDLFKCWETCSEFSQKKAGIDYINVYFVSI
jgi:hypothetical protein